MAWGDTTFPASQTDRDEAVELARQLIRQGYQGIHLNEGDTLSGHNDKHPYVQAMARRAYLALEDKNINPVVDVKKGESCKKPDCSCQYFCAANGWRI